jgi:glycosyltransferase involved in cell wall biosynthesis
VRLTLTSDFLTPTGGVELQMLQMSRELARRGHAISLLFNRDGELHADFEAFCASMTQVPTFLFYRTQLLRNMARISPALWAAVRSRPDVMYVNNVYQLAFGLGSGVLTRAPVVCHLHGSVLGREEIMSSKIPRYFERTHSVIACSDYVRNQFLDAGIDPSKISTIYNGIDLDRYPPATGSQRAEARALLGLPDDAFVALFFGRLQAEKGIDVVLEAWRHLHLPPSDARLLIVGSADADSDSAERVARLQASGPPGCQWLPARRDVVTPLHAADVVTVPSMWQEPFGRVVVEGLAAGLPVVASRVGGIPEILTGELEQFLFERGSAEELADRIRSLIGWRAERPDLGQRCHHHAAAHFGISRMVDAVEQVLHAAHGHA